MTGIQCTEIFDTCAACFVAILLRVPGRLLVRQRNFARRTISISISMEYYGACVPKGLTLSTTRQNHLSTITRAPFPHMVLFLHRWQNSTPEYHYVIKTVLLPWIPPSWYIPFATISRVVSNHFAATTAYITGQWPNITAWCCMSRTSSALLRIYVPPLRDGQ